MTYMLHTRQIETCTEVLLNLVVVLNGIYVLTQLYAGSASQSKTDTKHLYRTGTSEGSASPAYI